MAQTKLEMQRDFKGRHGNDATYIVKRSEINKRYKAKKRATESKADASLRRAKAALRKQKARNAARHSPQSPLKVSPSVLGKDYKKAIGSVNCTKTAVQSRQEPYENSTKTDCSTTVISIRSSYLL